MSLLSNVQNLQHVEKVVYEIKDIELEDLDPQLVIRENALDTQFMIKMTAAEMRPEISELMQGRQGGPRAEQHMVETISCLQKVDNSKEPLFIPPGATVLPITLPLTRNIGNDSKSFILGYLQRLVGIVGKNKVMRKKRTWIGVERQLNELHCPYVDKDDTTVPRAQESTSLFELRETGVRGIRHIGQEVVYTEGGTIQTYEGDPIRLTGFALVAPWHPSTQEAVHGVDWEAHAAFIKQIQVGSRVHMFDDISGKPKTAHCVKKDAETLEFVAASDRVVFFTSPQHVFQNSVFLAPVDSGMDNVTYHKRMAMDHRVYIYNLPKEHIEAAKIYFLPKFTEWLEWSFDKGATQGMEMIAAFESASCAALTPEHMHTIAEYLNGPSSQMTDLRPNSGTPVMTHTPRASFTLQLARLESWLQKCESDKAWNSTEVLKYSMSRDPFLIRPFLTSPLRVSFEREIMGVFDLKEFTWTFNQYETLRANPSVDFVVETFSQLFSTTTHAVKDQVAVLFRPWQGTWVAMLFVHNGQAWMSPRPLKRVTHHVTEESIELPTRKAFEKRLKHVRDALQRMAHPARLVPPSTLRYEIHDHRHFEGDPMTLDTVEFVGERNAQYVAIEEVKNTSIYHGPAADLIREFVESLSIRMTAETLDNLCEAFTNPDPQPNEMNMYKEARMATMKWYAHENNITGIQLKDRAINKKIQQIVEEKHRKEIESLHRKLMTKFKQETLMSKCSKVIAHLAIYIQSNLPNVVMTPPSNNCKAKFGLLGYPIQEEGQEQSKQGSLIEYLMCVAKHMIIPKLLGTSKVEYNGEEQVTAEVRNILLNAPALQQRLVDANESLKNKEMILRAVRSSVTGVWESFVPQNIHIPVDMPTKTSQQWQQERERHVLVPASRASKHTHPSMVAVLKKQRVLKEDPMGKRIDQQKVDVIGVDKEQEQHHTTRGIALLEALLSTEMFKDDNLLKGIQESRDAFVWNRVAERVSQLHKKLGLEGVYKAAVLNARDTQKLMRWTTRSLTKTLTLLIQKGVFERGGEEVEQLTNHTMEVLQRCRDAAAAVARVVYERETRPLMESALLVLYWCFTLVSTIQDASPAQVFVHLKESVQTHMAVVDPTWELILQAYEAQRESIKQAMIKTMDGMDNDERRVYSELKKRGMIDLRGELFAIQAEMDEAAEEGQDIYYRGENDDGDESGQDDY